jgi:hypothetical protein
MELREALTQIAEIRARVAETERFRGYRAVPVAASGVVAFITGLVQSRLAFDPNREIAEYLTLWVSAAVAGVLISGSGIWLRFHGGVDWLAREMTWLAVGQFAPCLVAGAMVTTAIVRHAPEHSALLPGLWQVFFSLGVFASCRLLPKAIVLVGVFYLAAGIFNLTRAGDMALSPWAMAIPFGIGQIGTAALLYWNLERANP